MNSTRNKDVIDQFRQQIRYRQKKDFFQKKRQQFQKQIIQDQWTVESLLQKLKKKQQISGCLQELTKIIQETNDHNKVIMQSIDRGIHHILIGFLKNQVELQLSITLISVILSKPNVKVANQFIRFGLLEYLLKFCQANIHYLRLSMNIFGNILSEDKNYNEIFLKNNVQRFLGNLLKCHVLQKNIITPEDQELGFLIMWVLEAMAQSEYGDQYKNQYLQIFSIVLQVMKADILHTVCMEIIFFLNSVIKQEMKYEVTEYINRLLLSMSPQANFVKHFLIIIKVFMPIQIDSVKFAYFIVKCPQYISYSLKIFEVILKHQPQNFPKQILNDEVWWQKICQYCKKLYDKQSYIRILNNLSVNRQWVFPIIRQFFESTSFSLTLSNILLDYLYNLLSTNTMGQDNEHLMKMVYLIKSFQIDDKIQSLYESKNHTIRKKCEMILGIINSASNDSNMS